MQQYTILQRSIKLFEFDVLLPTQNHYETQAPTTKFKNNELFKYLVF